MGACLNLYQMKWYCFGSSGNMDGRKEQTMAKVLIVEDEAKIARFVELELKYEG